MKRMALRMKELKLQPAALMFASAPAPRFFWDRQQNRMASPIIIWKHNDTTSSLRLLPLKEERRCRGVIARKKKKTYVVWSALSFLRGSSECLEMMLKQLQQLAVRTQTS